MNSNMKLTLIQTCLNKSCIPLEEFVSILNILYEDAGKVLPVNNKEQIQDIIKELNNELSAFNQSITLVKHEILGDEFVVLALASMLQVGSNHPFYKESERTIFTKLFKAMVIEPDFCIQWSQAFSIIENIPNSSKPLTKKSIAKLLECWTTQGYFVEKYEKLYFGPLLITEFANQLKLNYPEYINECPLCKQLVFWDLKCTDCEVMIHRDCIRKYLRLRSLCPSCNKPWSTRLSQ